MLDEEKRDEEDLNIGKSIKFVRPEQLGFFSSIYSCFNVGYINYRLNAMIWLSFLCYAYNTRRGKLVPLLSD